MMRIIFMGTPDFAVPALGAVLDAGHEVVAVYTQPPRAAGRGLGLKKSPVQLFAEGKGLPVFTPASLKSPEEQARFKSFNADAAVVVAYGLILPKPILEAPRFGCFNIHASLLPRWRGAAPIQRAIMAGDAETGVAIMRMEEGLDTGAVCLAERTPIWPDETAGELHDRLAALGAGLMVRALERSGEGLARLLAAARSGRHLCRQDRAVGHAHRLVAAGDEVQYQIQGLSPHPGAWFEIELAGKRERVRALRATLAEGEGKPGTLLDDQLTIACGKGAVRLTQVQRAGKRPMGAGDFLRGARSRRGDPQLEQHFLRHCRACPAIQGDSPTLSVRTRASLSDARNESGHDDLRNKWKCPRVRAPCPATSSSSNMTARRSSAGRCRRMAPRCRGASREAIKSFSGEDADPTRRRPHRCRRACARPGRPFRPRQGLGRRQGARCAERGAAARPDLGARLRDACPRFRRAFLGQGAPLSLPHHRPPQPVGARTDARLGRVPPSRRARPWTKRRRSSSAITTSPPSAPPNARRSRR